MDFSDDAGLPVLRVEELSWKWYAGENAIYASEMHEAVVSLSRVVRCGPWKQVEARPTRGGLQ
jgi:hypothetical protein